MSPFRYDISSENPRKAGETDSYDDNLEVDALIIGAGFGGVYLLKRLRDELGLKVKIYEAGTDFGGVWHWNTYPGAAVDSPVPCVYELSFPEVWKDWYWKTDHPRVHEMQSYFQHVVERLDVRKDVAFESRVTSCEYDQINNRWTVQTEDGRTARCTYLIVASGFAAKRNFPDWEGLENFKGQICHSSFWPVEGIDMKGKRLAVVGCGATGTQIVQTAGLEASKLTLFQRTCNIALPMYRKLLTREQQDSWREDYPRYFKDRMITHSGFLHTFAPRNTFDDTPETREKFYEKLWYTGGSSFWLANYQDLILSKEAGEEAYRFWRKKTLEIVTDPRKQELLVPEKSPYPFGTKRICLSEGYFEVLNNPKSEIVDISKTPVTEVKENGILTEDGTFRELDIIILATGFNAITGGLMDMGLKGIDGTLLKDKWHNSANTYLGLTTSGFPNFFFLYGPQGPTAFGNGPTTIELQGSWIVDAIAKMRREKISRLNPRGDSEREYSKLVKRLSDMTLLPLARSSWMGAYSQQKEQLNFAGGVPMYTEIIRRSLDRGFEGFETGATVGSGEGKRGAGLRRRSKI